MKKAAEAAGRTIDAVLYSAMRENDFFMTVPCYKKLDPSEGVNSL
jgi:hypothetical protein